jgi:hypothetical protein
MEMGDWAASVEERSAERRTEANGLRWGDKDTPGMRVVSVKDSIPEKEVVGGAMAG